MSVESAELLRRENETRIMQTVKNLLKDNNFSDLSLGEIAKSAGVAVRTINNIFGTKNCLLLMTAISAYKEEYARLDKLVASDEFAKQTGLEQVMALHYERAKFAREYPYITGTVSEIERQKFTNDREIELCNEYLSLTSVISSYYNAPIKKGRKDGTIKVDIKSEDIRHILFFSFGAIAQKLQTIGSNDILSKQVDVYATIRAILKMTHDYLGA